MEMGTRAGATRPHWLARFRPVACPAAFSSGYSKRGAGLRRGETDGGGGCRSVSQFNRNIANLPITTLSDCAKVCCYGIGT
jgi:hypothetical protein